MSASPREAIQGALAAGASRRLENAAVLLLNCLGYRSDRVLPGQSGRLEDLPEAFGVRTRNTQAAKAFREEATSVHVLFQVGDDEISESAQTSLLRPAAEFDEGSTRSFLFVAVELRGGSYSRTSYSQFAREMNQGLGVPAFVLFRSNSGLLTLAFVDRRRHRRDSTRDVLGRVSLIRDIDPKVPHRAHLDILLELSLDQRLRWMANRDQPRNFDGLRAAVLVALDTEALNKRFYKELFTWFLRAQEEVVFPTDKVDQEVHVIRLITRLLFVWFIKEKGLVNEDLFSESRIRNLLKAYDREGDSYYRAVLQNLFFATLNCEIKDRAWSTVEEPTHRIFSRYRYKEEVRAPERLLSLFSKTPFINGGLFDCQDSLESKTEGGFRVDCFSDNALDPSQPEHGMVSVPNRLFFDDAKPGDRADGLFSMFNRYKFTVEENTPVDVEVALDPELLGRCFENLLAAHVPETKESARKRTGSYYTPRDVVDWMAEEALVSALVPKLGQKEGGDSWGADRLHYLLDYEDACEDAQEFFEEDEKSRLIRAIAEVKVLDPACGSGAFPMGVLHKLTLALSRLDPTNEIWQGLQRDLASERAIGAFETPEKETRDIELQDISDAFESYRGLDFGRKLYLIQHSIFGVDIQPIACQIAKLRFFISLVIEQDYTEDPAGNHGIRPLPNLETRFVAADTLLALRRGPERHLTSDRTRELEGALRANRERHFHARWRREKQEAAERDLELRQDLAAELRRTGMPADEARRVADWDPYDQNAWVGWFDAEYMFGNRRGFDIVIGNPPYIQLQKDRGRLADKYKEAGFHTFVRTGDIYQLFIEKGLDLLGSRAGVLAYVTSNSWQKAQYGRKTRELLDTGGNRPHRLVNLGPGVFENAVVDTCVLMACRGPDGRDCRTAELRQGDTFPPAEDDWTELRQVPRGPWCVLARTEWALMEKIEAAGPPLREWPGISIYRGLVTGLNEAFIVDGPTKEALIREDARSAEILKPLVRGRDVGAYSFAWDGLWLIATHNGYGAVPRVDVAHYPAIMRHLHGFMPALEQRQDQGASPYNLRSCAYHAEFAGPKVLWRAMSDRPRFAYCPDEMYCNDKAYLMTCETRSDLLYLCAILGSRLIRWYGRHVTVTTGAGLSTWFKFSVESIPVPEPPTELRRALARPLVELTEEARGPNPRRPDATAKDFQTRTEQLVATLYGLTGKERSLLDSLLV